MTSIVWLCATCNQRAASDLAIDVVLTCHNDDCPRHLTRTGQTQ